MDQAQRRPMDRPVVRWVVGVMVLVAALWAALIASGFLGTWLYFRQDPVTWRARGSERNARAVAAIEAVLGTTLPPNARPTHWAITPGKDHTYICRLSIPLDEWRDDLSVRAGLELRQGERLWTGWDRLGWARVDADRVALTGDSWHRPESDSPRWPEEDLPRDTCCWIVADGDDSAIIVRSIFFATSDIPTEIYKVFD